MSTTSRGWLSVANQRRGTHGAVAVVETPDRVGMMSFLFFLILYENELCPCVLCTAPYGVE